MIMYDYVCFVHMNVAYFLHSHKSYITDVICLSYLFLLVSVINI